VKVPQDGIPPGAGSTRARQRLASEQVALSLWTCPNCGGAVRNPRHVRCAACIGADPAQAPEIRGRRGAAIAARKRALSEWDKTNPAPSMIRSCSAGRSAEASYRQAFRDRRGDRALEVLRQPGPGGEVHAARFDVVRARPASGRRG